MPANCVSRVLLIVSICAVWEALAKSLPDQGAFGKLAIRGMQHNEKMGVVAFLWLSVDELGTPKLRSHVGVKGLRIKGCGQGAASLGVSAS